MAFTLASRLERVLSGMPRKARYLAYLLTGRLVLRNRVVLNVDLKIFGQGRVILEDGSELSGKVAVSDSTLKIGQAGKSAGAIALSGGSLLELAARSESLSDLRLVGKSSLSIAEDTVLGRGRVDLEEGSVASIGSGSRLFTDALIPPTWHMRNAHLSVGRAARIHASISIKFGGTVRIGTFFTCNHGSEIRCEEEITIGDYVLVSYYVAIHDNNTHPVDSVIRRQYIERNIHGLGEYFDPPSDSAPISVGSDVWVGQNVAILKGAHIGARSIVGTNATVPKGDYPEDSVIVPPRPRVLER